MGTMTLKVQIGRRGLKTLASDAIKDDFMRGLIELVTNSDGSYCNIERRGEKTSGKIEISLLRKPRINQTLLRVSDCAEGMDAAKMKSAIAYGEDTSEDSGRGIFGMGLKDTVNAFGNGTITSIKDGMLFGSSDFSVGLFS